MGAVHVMSAFATGARFVLAQAAVADKSNEITAIPELLSCLELAGAVVSIDAMGCQKNIARQIVKQGADYVLALKDHHPQLCEDVKLWLDSELDRDAALRAQRESCLARCAVPVDGLERPRRGGIHDPAQSQRRRE